MSPHSVGLLHVILADHFEELNDHFSINIFLLFYYFIQMHMRLLNYCKLIFCFIGWIIDIFGLNRNLILREWKLNHTINLIKIIQLLNLILNVFLLSHLNDCFISHALHLFKCYIHFFQPIVKLLFHLIYFVSCFWRLSLMLLVHCTHLLFYQYQLFIRI